MSDNSPKTATGGSNPPLSAIFSYYEVRNPSIAPIANWLVLSYESPFMTQPNSLKPDRIMQFAWGYAPTLAIEAAVRHRVFDLLDKTPMTLEQLARETKASARGLRGILNLLVSLELLAKKGDIYSVTPESAAFLVSTKPGYHGMFFGHISDQLLPKWLQLSEIVRTAKPPVKVNQPKEAEEFFA